MSNLTYGRSVDIHTLTPKISFYNNGIKFSELNLESQRDLEVMGFSEHEINSLIFEKLKKDLGDESLNEDLLSFINQNKNDSHEK